MSEKKDGKAAPKDPPMEKPKVGVTATPQQNPDGKSSKENADYAKKVEKQVQRDVDGAIEKNAGGGRKRQLDGAKEAAGDAAKKIDGNKVKEVKVMVHEERDGKRTTHEIDASPPTPVAPAAPAPKP